MKRPTEKRPDSIYALVAPTGKLVKVLQSWAQSDLVAIEHATTLRLVLFNPDELREFPRRSVSRGIIRTTVAIVRDRAWLRRREGITFTGSPKPKRARARKTGRGR